MFLANNSDKKPSANNHSVVVSVILPAALGRDGPM